MDADIKGREARGFQSVLLELGARLGLPGMVDANGEAIYRDYADYMVHPRARARRRHAGRLAWRRRQAGKARASRIPISCSATSTTVASGARDSRSRVTTRWPIASTSTGRVALGIGSDQPIVPAVFETLQKFRPCREGHGDVQPPDEHRERVATYFDPLPMWYEPFRASRSTMSTALPTERADPAPDVHVPRPGFAERLAAANRHPQCAIRASEDGKIASVSMMATGPR